MERADRSIRGAGSSLTAVLAINVLFAAGLFSHALLYNFYLTELGLRARVFGNAAAALTLGGLIALIPAGMLVDRAGARTAYRIAALLLALGLAGGAFVTAPLAIYGCAIIAGLGTAVWRVAMAPLLIQQASERVRSRIFSWNVAALVGSGALWTFAAGAAPAWLAQRTGWNLLQSTRAALLIGAAGSIFGALLLMVIRPVGQAAAPRALPPNQRSAREVPAGFAILALVIGFWMLGSGLVIPFFNLFFNRVHELPLSRVGALFAIAQLVSAGALLVTAELSARLGAFRSLMLLSFAFAPLLWSLALAQTLTIVVGLFLLQSIIAPATNALIDQLLMEQAPADRRGAVSGWRNAATEASGFAGASGGGYIVELGGYRWLVGIAGVVALIGASLLALVFREIRRWLGLPPAKATPQEPVETLAIDGANRTV